LSELYSIPETASKLRISIVTLRRLISRSKISFKRIGKKYYFTNEDLETFLESVSFPIKDEK